MSSPAVTEPIKQAAPAWAASRWFDVRETGEVMSVREYIIKVRGLPSCMNGQLVDFARGGQGIVMGYNEREVMVLMLGAACNARAGDQVYSRGEPFLTPDRKSVV